MDDVHEFSVWYHMIADVVKYLVSLISLLFMCHLEKYTSPTTDGQDVQTETCQILLN